MVLPSGTSSRDSGPIEAPAAPAPPPPARRNRGGGWRKWRARFVVLLLLAAAVVVYLRISNDRAAESHRVSLDDVTLTAQAIPIEPVQAGRVTSVLVGAQQQVRAGQRVGTVEVAGFDRDGDPRITKVSLTAPQAGTVIDAPAPVGSTVQPNLPFLQLYDPAQMIFVAEVPVEDLTVIAPTMTADLRSEGMNRTVHATVQRVVPQVEGARTLQTIGPDQATDESDTKDSSGAMQVALAPASPQEVQGLVPGMRFTGYVDTVSGRPGTARLVSMRGGE